MNSIPKRLTMRKTNLLVAEQKYGLMPWTYPSMSYEPLGPPRLTGLTGHPQEGESEAIPCYYVFTEMNREIMKSKVRGRKEGREEATY